MLLAETMAVDTVRAVLDGAGRQPDLCFWQPALTPTLLVVLAAESTGIRLVLAAILGTEGLDS
jgi:hypothetical protein